MTSVCVITGAAGAMGQACTRALASAVDTVLLTDVDEVRLDTAAERAAHGTSATVCTAVGDLGEPDFVLELASRTRSLGTFHSLVHTAGLSPSMAAWGEILRVDLAAVERLLDAFLPLVGPGSSAVCLASVSGHMGEFDPAMNAVLDAPLADDFEARFRAIAGDEPDPGATYRLAKHGVVRLCERAAATWGARGGRVVSLSPGLIDTDMGWLELEHNPIKRWLVEMTPVGGGRSGSASVLPGRADDIADAVAFLCSERARFISGCDLRVDGGLAGALHHRA